MKNVSIVIDWKLVAVLGASVVCGVFSTKISPEAVERVLISMIDTCKELVSAELANY